ncbi:sigma 54-interacting transcriptional regulator [Clostridium sp. D2Q-14]|uniref:sigma 54-interacting transcriptional regulator n=1 Tax=Anaeromonas gelatinilytica TaxID=2683194 RepID=UPI00193C50A5|nr:sigma-54-dependent transcriptional regulator [Anaeromonas gelatinilytica]MBS4535585.1 sigma 54-interacting transcriptional regulator [Anaeromonas gelatinilytica]
MLKDKLLLYLKEKTLNFKFSEPSKEFTAMFMAGVFEVKRNTISHNLNQLVKDKRVIKINTRPVYFLSKEGFEEEFFSVENCVFKDLDELKRYGERYESKLGILENIIGAYGSLKKAIEQIKSSVFYPEGLPLILCGSTGVGKSYTAKLIYQYSVESGVLSKDAPFITFNCAQYANNPELLSSNLFGYVKGAFTGADKTTHGMLEAADGGILFLDEVHRLNEEGQEKLFTFLDQGVFKRMGEYEGWHRASVRIIFATTLSLEENFLKTFLRRIPIRINIPDLEDRGEKEKKQFIYKFLIDESKKIKLPLEISNKALDLLKNYRYNGNLGELKNTIKYLVASSFAKNPDLEYVSISLYDLLDKVLKETVDISNHKFKQNSQIIISPTSELDDLFKSNITQTEYIEKTYKNIINLFIKNKKSYEKLEQNIFDEIVVLFDKFLFGTERSTGTMLKLITVNIQEIIQHLEYINNIKFNGNSVYAIAHFLFYKGNSTFEWSDSQMKIIKQIENFIKENYSKEEKLAKDFIELLGNKLDVYMDKMDEIILIFYLRSLSIETTDDKQVRAIILAHGYATASSISNVANRLLKKNIFEAFDMPLDTSVDDIVRRVLDYIEYTDVSKGLVILVDMGSLKDVHSKLTNYTNGPIAIINNVSTQMALIIGDKIINGAFLEDMIEKIKIANKTDYRIIYPEKRKKKVIVTTCLTGMGTAIQIQKLLESSIPSDIGVKVLSYEYNRLGKFAYDNPIFHTYDVIAIIGTNDPGINEIDYIPLEDLISGQGERKMKKIFHSVASNEQIKEINDNLLKNFSLEQVIESITILDTDKILNYVEEFLSRLEILLNICLTNDKKVALYIHTSCLVERLIRQAPIDSYNNIEKFKDCQKDMIKNIKEAFSVIEAIYNVKINTAEIGYIYDYIIS